MESYRWFWFVTILAFAGLLAGCPDRAQVGAEICGNGEDDDGDGEVDEGCPVEPDAGPEEDGGDLVDEDHDGYSPDDPDEDRQDCDDLQSLVHPGAIEVCNSIDDDCDGDVDEDCGPCQEDEDCGEGRICVDEECASGCRRDSQCDSDQECVDGQCQDVEQPACEEEDDCGDEHACTEDFCDPAEGCEHVAHDERCPDDFVCDREDGCVRSGPAPECEVDDDCPSDGVACTLEDCRDSECVSVPRDDRCDDDEVCDLDDGCVRSSDCESDLDCTDDIACTSDFCEGGECFHTERDDRCGDNEECRAGSGCIFTGECDSDGDCSDGLWCNGSERCIASECESGTRDCSDGNANTVDSCNEATDACDHVQVVVEVCDGVDNDGDGLRDETFACVLGASQACATGCGSTGSQTCGAGCVWGACIPPAESCNARDDDCDGSTDEGGVCGGVGCGMPNTVYFQGSSGVVGNHTFYSDLEDADAFCGAGWNGLTDGAAPYEWTLNGSSGLHTVNVRGTDGNYAVYITGAGQAGGSCAIRAGWTLTVRIGGVDRVVEAHDANRNSIAANSAVLAHDESGWCNVITCLGASACELDCSDNVDSDGDGVNDANDPDCLANRADP